MHILQALSHRYRDHQKTQRYHSMIISQVTRTVLGQVYDRLVYKNQIIKLINCGSYDRLMIYIHKKKIIGQIQEKINHYHIVAPIKDIRFGS